jgi:predicted phosphodiesterase
MDDWFLKAKELYNPGIYGYRQIAREFNMNVKTVESRFRAEKARTGQRQEVVGVIGDTHFPFVHPNYIHFLEDTFRKYRVTRIVHVGDLVDNHAISRHQTETDADGALTEYEQAAKCVEQCIKAFDSVTITMGNHDAIPERQAATLGIPRCFLKGFTEAWGLPKKWSVEEKLIINGVLYEHGINWTGKHGALDKAVNARQSCVIGHSHSFAGCNYQSNSESLIFGLNVGCGVDIDACAMRYGRYNKNRETLGCGIVFDSANAIFVPMGDRYFRRGK